MNAGDLVPGRRPGGRLPGRLFVTVCLVYLLHFAPNVVRETYLAIALGDDFSIRVDPYLGLHPDLFQIPGRGAYIDNNPGASLLGALPYVVARPVLALLFRLKPELVAPKPAATYDDPRPNRTRFMNEARARGLDVKLGLAAATMHAGLMVPLAGLATVLVFLFLRERTGSEDLAKWLALLYAFGTPMFFRSGFLNQNMILAHCTLLAYLALAWRPPESLPESRRLFAAGLCLGFGLLCDYSAAPLLLAFGLWVVAIHFGKGGAAAGVRAGASFTLGAAGPIALLLGYQWAAFGNPLLPAQAYMPSTDLSVEGWHGFRVPSAELLWGNLFHRGYGLFAFCPMLVAAVLAPRYRNRMGGLNAGEVWLIAGGCLALYIFSSSVAFAALQWNTGVRYLVPAGVLLFFALVPVLLNLPRWVAYALVIPTVAVSWSVAMVREDVVTSLMHVFLRGFELPWLTTFSKTADAYLPFLKDGSSPLAILVLAAATIWLVWRPADPREPLASPNRP